LLAIDSCLKNPNAIQNPEAGNNVLVCYDFYNTENPTLNQLWVSFEMRIQSDLSVLRHKDTYIIQARISGPYDQS